MIAFLSPIWLLACFTSLAASETIQDIFNHENWFSIASEQTIKSSNKELWEVQEIFSLGEEISFSFHRNLVTEESFSLLSKDTRNYFLTSTGSSSGDEKECRLDHRQDHTTNYPWRYSKGINFLSKGSYEGVGALWLNAIKNKVDCKKLESDSKRCIFQDKKSRFEVQFDFQSNNRLASIHFEHDKVFHAKETRIMQDLSIDIEITAIETQVDSSEITRVLRLLQFCRDHVKSDSSLFPSLIRELAESYRRNYYLAYIITRYNLTGEGYIKEAYSFQEWFSYEQELQLIKRRAKKTDLSDSFYKLFRYRHKNNDKTLTFWLKPSESKPGESQCNLEEFDQEFTSISGLMQRKMRFFRANLTSNGGKKHSGILLGLGALLMNVADLHDKDVRMNPSTKLETTDRWVSTIEWVVSGHEQGEEIHFFFRKRSLDEYAESKISDLFKIEMRESVSIANNPFSYRIVAVIDILDYSTVLLKDELDKTFLIPDICPPTGAIDDVDQTEIEATSTEKPQRNDEDDLTDSYDFPNFEEYLDLSRDYMIDSKWQYSNGTHVSINERFMFAGKDEGAVLFGRLNVIRDSDKPMRLYLRYPSDSMIETTDEQCRRVEKAAKWIELFSSELSYQLESPTNGGVENTLRHYGVGGLWKLVAKSPFTEFLGFQVEQTEGNKVDGGKEYAVWRLVDDPQAANFNLEFKFAVLNRDAQELNLKFQLDSIEIDTKSMAEFEPVESISIKDIKVEVGSTNPIHFILPHFCGSNLHKNLNTHPMPSFPTFQEAFKANKLSKVSFDLRFELLVSSNTSKTFYKTREAYNHQVGLGQIAFSSMKNSINSNKLVLWTTNDDDVSFLEEQAGRRCKRVSSPKQFFMVQPYLQTLQSGLREMEKLERNEFLLANLWYLMSLHSKQLASKLVSRTNFIDRSGVGVTQRLVVWTYSSVGRDITFTFIHSHLEDRLNLFSVNLQSRNVSDAKFRIFVREILQIGLIESALPDSCLESKNVEFNKLVDLLKPTDTLHISSELTTNLEFMETKSSYFPLDEWYQPVRGFRTRATGKIHTFDYLVYEETKEFFDLTYEFNCQSLLMSIRDGDEKHWIVDNLLIADHDGASYGPIAVWLFASQDEISKKLITDDISIIDAEDGGKVDFWFKNDRWLVWDNKTDYLEFTIQFQQTTSNPKLPFLLTRIEANNWRKAKNGEIPQRVTVDVVSFELVDKLNPEQLLIPVGYGCKRNKIAKERYKSNDKLAFHPTKPIDFAYEASLSVVDDDGVLSRRDLVQTGWLGRCPNAWSQLGILTVNNQRLHYMNGTLKATRKVSFSDGTTRLIRYLDEITGFCLIKRQTESADELISLNFAVDDPEEEPIHIRFDLIGLLEGSSDVREFEVIQLVQDPNSKDTKIVLEYKVPQFMLNKQQSGFASIVRTFKRSSDMKSIGGNYEHSSVKIEVIIQKKAHLTMNIQGSSNPQCHEILHKAGVEDCSRSSEFQIETNVQQSYVPQRIRSFEMSLLAEQQQVAGLRKKNGRDTLLNEFIDRILSAPIGLSPMQLGKVHLMPESDEYGLRLRLNLLEPPSAIEYFYMVSNFSIQETVGSIKLKSSKHTCSLWCDSMNCIALSYCPDRSCQVLTRADMGQRAPRIKTSPSCEYYHAPIGGPFPTTNEFVKTVQTRILGDEHNDALSLSLNGFNLQVTEMVEISNSLDTRSQFEDQEIANRVGFTVWKIGKSLDNFKLKSISGIKFRSSRVTGEAECLDLAIGSQFTVVSYNTAIDWCIIVGDVMNWMTLAQVLEASVDMKDCSILIRDFTRNYHVFSDTVEPKEYADFSKDLSLIECASRCELSEHLASDAKDCLSFDYCSGLSGTRCYTQKMHVIMDDFDESIMKSQNVSFTECAHYSKTLISDFEQIPRKQLAKHEAITYKGTKLDNCALICRRDETCRAFEYCSYGKDSSNTCYIVRDDHLRDTLNNVTLGIGDEVFTKESEECTIYNVRHTEEKIRFGQSDHLETDISGQDEERIEDELEDKRIELNPHLLQFILASGILFAALVLGALLQVTTIMLTGRSLPPHSRRVSSLSN